MPQKRTLYSDFDLSFSAHPILGSIKVLKDNDAITQALKILILTDKYERLCNPDIFTNIRATLFENFTQITAAILEQYIRTAVSNYEKRSRLIDLKIEQEDDQNRISINFVYQGVNNFSNVSVKMFIDKVR